VQKIKEHHHYSHAMKLHYNTDFNNNLLLISFLQRLISTTKKSESRPPFHSENETAP